MDFKFGDKINKNGRNGIVVGKSRYDENGVLVIVAMEEDFECNAVGIVYRKDEVKQGWQ